MNKIKEITLVTTEKYSNSYFVACKNNVEQSKAQSGKS